METTKDIILYGASGHGKVIMDILDAINIKLDYIVDDNPNIDNVLGCPVRRNLEPVYGQAIISIGSNEIRKKISETLSVSEFLTAIHPTAIISPSAKIGKGSVVMQGAIVQTCVEIGDHCIINTGSSIDHECRISNYVHISPGAILSGNVEIGEGTWIGAGTVIKQGVKIGSWSIVGAGSVVVDDIPANVVAFGNKCKVIKNR